KCAWIEPYYLKSEQKWGILVGFQFVVKEELNKNGKNVLDKDILIASGSLNTRGLSNLDFYLYKHDYIKLFIQNILPQINNTFGPILSSDLYEVDSYTLKAKEYSF